MRNKKIKTMDLDSRLVTINLLYSKFNEMNSAIKELTKGMSFNGTSYRFSMRLLNIVVSRATEISDWLKSGTYKMMTEEFDMGNKIFLYEIKYTEKTISEIKSLDEKFMRLKNRMYTISDVDNLLCVTRNKTTIKLLNDAMNDIDHIIALNKSYVSLIREIQK